MKVAANVGARPTSLAPREAPDLERWPALAPPKAAPLRAAVARRLLGRVASQAGIRIRLSDGVCFGPKSGPTMQLLRPSAFFTRLGRDGKIGFGESYMAGDWDSLELVEVLETMARRLDTLVPPPAQRLRAIHDARHPPGEDNDRSGAKRNITRHYDLYNDSVHPLPRWFHDVLLGTFRERQRNPGAGSVHQDRPPARRRPRSVPAPGSSRSAQGQESWRFGPAGAAPG